MSSSDADQPRVLSLSPGELDLLLAALRLLLAAEDDPETIDEVKRLIARLEAADPA